MIDSKLACPHRDNQVSSDDHHRPPSLFTDTEATPSRPRHLKGPEIALVIRVGCLELLPGDGRLVTEGPEEAELFLAVGAVGVAALGHRVGDGVGAGENFLPGGVVAEIVFAGLFPRRTDDGAESAGMAVGGGGPGAGPGAGGGGDLAAPVIGDGLFPFALKAATTGEEESGKGEEKQGRRFHAWMDRMKRDFASAASGGMR